jgi:hypothetical protein
MGGFLGLYDLVDMFESPLLEVGLRAKTHMDDVFFRDLVLLLVVGTHLLAETITVVNDDGQFSSFEPTLGQQ